MKEKLLKFILTIMPLGAMFFAGYQCGSHNSIPQTNPEPIIGYTVLNADSVIKANGDTVRYDRRVHKVGKK